MFVKILCQMIPKFTNFPQTTLFSKENQNINFHLNLLNKSKGTLVP